MCARQSLDYGWENLPKSPVPELNSSFVQVHVVGGDWEKIAESWNTLDMGLSDCTLIKSGSANNTFASFELKWNMDWRLSHGLTTSLSLSPGVLPLDTQLLPVPVPAHADVWSHTCSSLHKHCGFLLHLTQGITWYTAGQFHALSEEWKHGKLNTRTGGMA